MATYDFGYRKWVPGTNDYSVPSPAQPTKTVPSVPFTNPNLGNVTPPPSPSNQPSSVPSSVVVSPSSGGGSVTTRVARNGSRSYVSIGGGSPAVPAIPVPSASSASVPSQDSSSVTAAVTNPEIITKNPLAVAPPKIDRPMTTGEINTMLENSPSYFGPGIVQRAGDEFTAVNERLKQFTYPIADTIYGLTGLSASGFGKSFAKLQDYGQSYGDVMLQNYLGLNKEQYKSVISGGIRDALLDVKQNPLKNALIFEITGPVSKIIAGAGSIAVSEATIKGGEILGRVGANIANYGSKVALGAAGVYAAKKLVYDPAVEAINVAESYEDKGGVVGRILAEGAVGIAGSAMNAGIKVPFEAKAASLKPLAELYKSKYSTPQNLEFTKVLTQASYKAYKSGAVRDLSPQNLMELSAVAKTPQERTALVNALLKDESIVFGSTSQRTYTDDKTLADWRNVEQTGNNAVLTNQPRSSHDFDAFVNDPGSFENILPEGKSDLKSPDVKFRDVFNLDTQKDLEGVNQMNLAETVPRKGIEGAYSMRAPEGGGIFAEKEFYRFGKDSNDAIAGFQTMVNQLGMKSPVSQQTVDFLKSGYQSLDSKDYANFLDKSLAKAGIFSPAKSLPIPVAEGASLPVVSSGQTSSIGINVLSGGASGLSQGSTVKQVVTRSGNSSGPSVPRSVFKVPPVPKSVISPLPIPKSLDVLNKSGSSRGSGRSGSGKLPSDTSPSKPSSGSGSGSISGSGKGSSIVTKIVSSPPSSRPRSPSPRPSLASSPSSGLKNIPEIPGLVIPNVPGLGGGFKKGGSSKGSRRRLMYEPSLVAVVKGVKSKKKPGLITGIDIRPLIGMS